MTMDCSLFERAGALSCVLHRLPCVHVALCTLQPPKQMLGEHRIFFLAAASGSEQTTHTRGRYGPFCYALAMTFGRLKCADLDIVPLRRSTIRLIVMDTHQAKGADTRQPKTSGLSVYSDNGMHLRLCLLKLLVRPESHSSECPRM
jgi:hypothetical protein